VDYTVIDAPLRSEKGIMIPVNVNPPGEHVPVFWTPSVVAAETEYLGWGDDTPAILAECERMILEFVSGRPDIQNIW
jgi:hypothetical protein